MLRLFTIVLWPSFLAAIVAEGLFFSLFDSYYLPLDGSKGDDSPMAVYAMVFFLLWLACTLASAITCYLSTWSKKPVDSFEC